ncbi:carbon-nitrogen hydrolase [Violaceomyces palustris]|uniref:Carbon-nitrogen hydrolase n=1 Tax=Violaceomyces palustris TaxID=1673888 RepID=A0ACD0NUM7_9BASI|nr:carbon-nitrogen hydrolase [Violaceomyces palustris]
MPEYGLPRVACLQLDSKHADVEQNAQKVESLTNHLRPGSLDILVLPELALTGYVFKDHEEISGFLEGPSLPSSSSPTLKLASDIARRLCCYVVAGLPEKAVDSSSSDQGSQIYGNNPKHATCVSTSQPRDARPLDADDHSLPQWAKPAYNSALLVDRQGRHIHTFRKHFLYEDDKRWSLEGPGFQVVDLPDVGRICVAICMDLNPYEFKTDFGKFELANFCRELDVDALIVPMAWLLPPQEACEVPDLKRPSMNTINYWAMRLEPLFVPAHSIDSEALEDDEASLVPKSVKGGKAMVFAAANRTGKELSSVFAGSSCQLLIQMNQRPLLLGALGISEEGVLLPD